ncbi:MAG: molybdate ABC transporter permease subunit [Oscillospiraceae bacterium]|nr:molybdate ABC transporter permease subunit [Oscillospiraceae bacterium]
MNMDWSPLWISVKTAAVSTCLTFVLGIAAAKAVTSMKKGKAVADSILSLPLVLPPTVLGFFLLLLFGKNSVLGRLLAEFDVTVIFTWQGAVIAATAASFPIMYRTVRGAFEQVDRELVDAAVQLGCSRAQTFIYVWIPLAWQGIASGLTMSFARALGEFGATIMIAGNLPGKTRTMSVAVYTAMQSGDRELAFRWTAVILALSLAMLAAINFMTGRALKDK